MFKENHKFLDKLKNWGAISEDLGNAMLVTTFFFLWLAVNFSHPVEQILAFLLIFSFGILHGANDLEILRRQRASSVASGPGILIIYIAFVLASALLFYLAPTGALLFFIFFSAYHFGEQHWVKRMGKVAFLQKLLYFSYGMALLLMLFQAHGPEVSGIMAAISGHEVPVVWFQWGFLVSLGLFLVVLFANFYWTQFQRYLLRELFLLGLFYVVFHTASLIWAFAIYFVIWHSIPSLADQIRLLYGNLTVKSGLKYVRSSAVYWVGALVTLALAFLYFRGEEYGFLPIFFSFLAAITFPHVLVITRLYRN